MKVGRNPPGGGREKFKFNRRKKMIKIICVECNSVFETDDKYAEYYKNNQNAGFCKPCDDELDFIQNEADINASLDEY
jgi:hypothetical protein